MFKCTKDSSFVNYRIYTFLCNNPANKIILLKIKVKIHSYIPNIMLQCFRHFFHGENTICLFILDLPNPTKATYSYYI